MARSPLLVLLLFLSIHASASHGSPLLPTYDGSMCSQSIECGSVDISYPFYLSNAIGVTDDYTSYSCGYTDLKIFYQADGETKTPILQLGRDNYTIQDIAYDNRTIILADTDALLGVNCPRVRHSVAFSPVWLNYTDSFDSLTFFLDCDLLVGAEKYKINCIGFNSPGLGGKASYVFSSEQHDDVPEKHVLATWRCGQNVVVPVQRDVLMRSDTNMLPWEYGAVLKQGFELAWNHDVDRGCYLCEQSYGRCSYSQKKEFLGCLCSDGKVGVQYCNSNGASTASASNKFFRN